MRATDVSNSYESRVMNFPDLGGELVIRASTWWGRKGSKTYFGFSLYSRQMCVPSTESLYRRVSWRWALHAPTCRWIDADFTGSSSNDPDENHFGNWIRTEIDRLNRSKHGLNGGLVTLSKTISSYQICMHHYRSWSTFGLSWLFGQRLVPFFTPAIVISNHSAFLLR